MVEFNSTNSQIVELDPETIEIVPAFGGRGDAPDGYNPAVVERYREMVDLLPPVKVWQREDGQICLVDGRHSLEAHRLEKRRVKAIFQPGSYDDIFVLSRTSNLKHGLAYSRTEWRAVLRDIVRLRCTRANAWIAREAGCGRSTIARIRAELELENVIPVLEMLETEDGRLVQRARAEAELVTGEIEDHEIEAEDEEPAATGKGGQDSEADRHQQKDNALSLAGDDAGMTARPRTLSLKIAQVGPPLAIEVGLWVNGQVESVPVTLIIAAQTPPVGLEAATPEHPHCLLISQVEARRLDLLWD